MNPAVDLATTALIVAASNAEQEGIALPVACALRLRYFREDPHAVHLAILDTEPVEWVLARDTLRDGLALAIGDGDVRIVPCGPDVHLRIHGRDDKGAWGTCIFEIARDILQAFIARSYQLVPSGTEGEHIDWDTELAALLGGAR